MFDQLEISRFPFCETCQIFLLAHFQHPALPLRWEWPHPYTLSPLQLSLAALALAGVVGASPPISLGLCSCYCSHTCPYWVILVSMPAVLTVGQSPCLHLQGGRAQG